MNRAEALRRRGVLLIVVDASKMPVHQVGLLATIGDQAPGARYLHRAMIDSLVATYEGRFGVVEIDLPPDTDSNTYTSWALDHESLNEVRRNFARGAPGWRRAIAEQVATLRAPGGRIAPPALPRVPTD